MPRPDWIDNPSIQPDDIIWHGVPERQIETEPDGTQRPRTGSFMDREPSINVAKLAPSPQFVIDKASKLGVKWRLWAMKAGDVRALDLWLDCDPEPADSEKGIPADPSHGVILRSDAPGKQYLKQSQAKRLCRIGYWEDEGPPDAADTPTPEDSLS
jgi:hypothetical protein